MAQFAEGVRIKPWVQRLDLGTVENGGAGTHGRDAVHTDTNNGVEGRRTKEDNAMRTATKNREYENGGGVYAR